MFGIHCAIDEAQVHMYGEHIQASHEGLFIRRCVWGSLPLGYIGEDVPGELTRRQRPRMKIIIDAWILNNSCKAGVRYSPSSYRIAFIRFLLEKSIF